MSTSCSDASQNGQDTRAIAPGQDEKSSTKAPWFILGDGNAGEETEEFNQARTFVSTELFRRNPQENAADVVYCCLYKDRRTPVRL
jgi:hypothetical protein